MNGDSGGPLVGRDRNGKPVQISVVSWGDECGAAGNYLLGKLQLSDRTQAAIYALKAGLVPLDDT